LVLNDKTIRYYGDDLITPFLPERVQPASYDLALGNDFILFDLSTSLIVDMDLPEEAGRKVTLKSGDHLLLQPGQFVLGVTEEVIMVPSDLMARLEGKSTIGRKGLMIHVTAGFVDPGWEGRLTLEIYNLRRIPIILRPGRTICQIAFSQMIGSAAIPYNGRYQGDMSVESSKTHKQRVS
jgi:dCTP deaminase